MSAQGAPNFRELVDLVQRQGFEVTKTERGHWRARNMHRKDVPIVHFADSGDHRATMNTIRDLKKAGFRWPADQFPVPEDAGPGPSLPALVLPAAPTFEIPIPTALPEDPERHMDRLYAELKGARIVMDLAREELAAKHAAMLRASEEFKAAAAQHARAEEDLDAHKARFDEAFATGPART